MVEETWDLSGRDVVPDLAPAGRPRDPAAAVLLGLLKSDGQPWEAPYDAVRRAMSVRAKAIEPEREDMANQRLRTYLALFRGLGLVYEAENTLHVTPLGTSIRSLLDQNYQSTDSLGLEIHGRSRQRLARLVAPALARYQLASPLSTKTYPPNTDIHPLWAIWYAMRSLDNRLHWEELGRALTPCLRHEDLQAAVDRVRTARLHKDYDLRDPDVLTSILGPRRPDMGDDQSDRLDTWFSRAGFKGLLLEPRDRADGFRHLAEDFMSLIDEQIGEVPEFNGTMDRGTYVNWLGQTGPDGNELVDPDDLVSKVVDRSTTFGDRKIIALAGPAGTGKTRAALRAARILADYDESRILNLQFHAAMSYEEFVGGLAPAGPGEFVRQEGSFLKFNAKAHQEPTLKHVAVIDEFSRADIANVLGELLTYIEYRNREFYVPALQQNVSLAENLILIVTLNPEDRSVVNMDDALVRRLRQVSVPPDHVALREILVDAGMPDALVSSVVDWFNGLPPDAPFGHGMFVGVSSREDLYSLWHEQLQFFLRRGGVSVYPQPELIEQGYVWRFPTQPSPSG